MFFLLVTAFLALFSIYLYRYLTFWDKQGIPNNKTPKLSWMFKSIDQFLEEVRTVEHPLFGSTKFLSKVLIVNDPKFVRELSIKDLHKFPLRFDVWFGRSRVTSSLFFSEVNDNWKRLRNILSPAFTSGKLKSMIEPIQEIADQFVEHLKVHADNGDVFDIKPFCDSFTMDTIARCGYGIKIDSLNQPNHPIILNAKKILNFDMKLKQFVCIMFPPLARFFEFEFFDEKAVKYFEQLTNDIVEQRKQSSNNHYSDLIGMMMKELDNDKLTMEELSAQSILFFIAGYDTTNAAFDHILYYMAKNPEWQNKLYDELKNNSVKQYEILQELPILNAIINETLRLKPSLTVIERLAKEDCTFLDTSIQIPKDTTISISPYLIHRNAEYFPDPECFLPERFIGTNLESNIAYMPFGVGSRFCIGMRFALNELRIGVANFFLNYIATLPGDFQLEYYRGSILLSPKTVKLRISHRNK